jgi:hypothetical protein
MSNMDFWLGCVTKALKCAGIEATDIQINKATGFIEGCYTVHKVSDGGVEVEDWCPKCAGIGWLILTGETCSLCYKEKTLPENAAR